MDKMLEYSDVSQMGQCSMLFRRRQRCEEKAGHIVAYMVDGN